MQCCLVINWGVLLCGGGTLVSKGRDTVGVLYQGKDYSSAKFTSFNLQNLLDVLVKAPQEAWAEKKMKNVLRLDQF